MNLDPGILEQSAKGEKELPPARIADSAAQGDGTERCCSQHTQHSILP
jgi:hypothetical protein